MFLSAVNNAQNAIIYFQSLELKCKMNSDYLLTRKTKQSITTRERDFIEKKTYFLSLAVIKYLGNVDQKSTVESQKLNN